MTFFLSKIVCGAKAQEIKNDETIYVELARVLENDYDVTISVTCRISSNTDAKDSILHGVDSTVFEVGELKYKKGNDVPLIRA